MKGVESIPKGQAFVDDVEKLSSEQVEQNAALDTGMKELKEFADSPVQVDLDKLRISEIRDRLHMSPDSVARINAHDTRRENAGRYLRELSASAGIENPALAAVIGNLGGEGAHEPLSAEAKEDAERFLLGDKAYEKRMGRLREKFPEGIPDEKKAQTLKAAFEALTRSGYREEDKDAPWRDRVGPMQRFQERVLEGMRFSANMPVRELAEFLAREGAENFMQRSALGKSEKPLAEILRLDALKEAIDRIPEDAAPEERAAEYLKLIDTISHYTKREFPYDKEGTSLAQMKEGKANCAGYALLGSLALKELGVPSVFIAGTRHAFAGFILPNGRFYINHFQGKGSIALEDDDLNKVTSEDLKAFMYDDSRTAMALPLALGTPIQWWNNSGPQGAPLPETVYLSKSVEPALLAWIYARNSARDALSSEVFIKPGDVADSLLLPRNRESLVRVVERSPNDLLAMERLSEVISSEDGNEFSHRSVAVGARWANLYRNMHRSKKGKRERSVWTKLGRILKKK